jgi:hypothetical protein
VGRAAKARTHRPLSRLTVSARGQLRAGGVHHRHEWAELDVHRGRVASEDVQDVDR